MKNKNLFVKVVFVVLIILLLLSLVVPVIFSQATPKKDSLLNGLKVLMFTDPKADKVSLKVRIHAGSAFDPQGKEGLMQILSDNLFPTEAAREFFAEDLGGGLEVVTNYDYIQVNASAKPDQFLTMLETIAGAVSNPPIDKENTAKLKNVLSAKVKALESDPAYVADHAVARRLFGTFPYGRPRLGTEASLQKIDFADLIDARQRFLTADNATIAVSGNFDRSLALRAIKRYFGGWLKSDKRVPATFRQPDDPPTEVLTVTSPKAGAGAARYAFRSVARNDRDVAASMVFSSVLQNRLRSRAATAHESDVSVRNDTHMHPGIITVVIPPKQNPDGSSSLTREATDVVTRSLTDTITEAEFQAARSAVRTQWSARDETAFWLDADTFGLANPGDQHKLVDALTLNDVTAYAEKARKLPIVAVLVTAATPSS